MKKLLIFIFTLVVLTSNLYAHTSHYKDLKKIEMEILKDGKVIGYNYYFFEKVDDILIIDAASLFFMTGSSTFMPKNMEVQLTCMMVLKSSRDCSSMW